MGELPEKAEATECPRRLLGQLELDMGLEKEKGFDGCEGGGVH